MSAQAVAWVELWVSVVTRSGPTPATVLHLGASGDYNARIVGAVGDGLDPNISGRGQTLFSPPGQSLARYSAACRGFSAAHAANAANAAAPSA